MYFVSRQMYYPTGECVVEIAAGGLNYANPDMLADKDGIYNRLGCGAEYRDPREALRVAFAIRGEWLKHTEKPVRIEMGYTHGFTMPFEEHPEDVKLMVQANQEYESLPKCNYCGDIMPDDERKRWRLCFPYDSEEEYCSEQCADRAYEGILEYEQELEEDYA